MSLFLLFLLIIVSCSDNSDNDNGDSKRECADIVADYNSAFDDWKTLAINGFVPVGYTDGPTLWKDVCNKYVIICYVTLFHYDWLDSVNFIFIYMKIEPILT